MSRFGRSLLPLWPLDPDATYLNHGTVGVTPLEVLQAQQQLRNRIERHPARFMLRELWTFTGAAPDGQTLMRQAASEVAAFVGARPRDLVFVDNTTAGVNAVLLSLRLQPGDEIVLTDHVYGGIVAAVNHRAGRGVTVTTVEVPYPKFDSAALVERVAAALTSRTRLVIIEHIAAESALIFPAADIVRLCRKQHVPVLVDGAHVPGQLPLDVGLIGADFYVANLHKWAMAPRSSAFMVVAPPFQGIVHPPVISWGLGSGLTQEFDWVGTRDPTPWLLAPAGIKFLQELGFDNWQRYTHALAWHAARHLTDLWQTPLQIQESAVASMVSVMTPKSCGTTKDDAVRLRDRLLFEHNIEVQVHPRAGRVWIRISAQAYNDMDDVERLGRAVLESIH